MSPNDERGILFVISAPSGAGKSTLARKVVGATPGLRFSVSFTTRPRRADEREGDDYHFVDDARFEQMTAAGSFLEWAHVHEDRYGTARKATEEALAAGDDLLLDIDVQGAAQIRQSGVDAVFIFIMPPDFGTLEERLRSRSSEDEARLERRLAIAGRETAEYPHYDYLVINDELDRAFHDLCSIVRSERRRISRRRGEADEILKTIPRPEEAGPAAGRN